MIDQAELVSSLIINLFPAIMFASKAGRIKANMASRQRVMVKMEGRAIRRIKGRQVVVRDLIFMNFSGFVLLKTNIFLRSEKKCIAPTQIDILYYYIFRTEESPFLSALIIVHNRL